ncbi:hypothetical protein DKM44_11540 [Deinococcus irradiatisoli]|uniref:Uncharacterized protein n=1 Tax=Deinococcus irradiatisoli TaxID=2202254 RepID=A0A2Z3JLN0_9DEIO|nr:hypothetical protein [Deinococcus irradiatisoli]AWN23779.1 hypothetical protein DKM44_11540 [Deinococcus irradiatisoli]
MFWKKKVPANPNVLDAGGGVYHVRVRTRLHGDEVALRFTKAAHIGAAEEGQGYVLRKPIVSSEHFDRGEIAVYFDANYRITKTEAEGVEFIPVSEWPRD